MIQGITYAGPCNLSERYSGLDSSAYHKMPHQSAKKKCQVI